MTRREQSITLSCHLCRLFLIYRKLNPIHFANPISDPYNNFISYPNTIHHHYIYKLSAHLSQPLSPQHNHQASIITSYTYMQFERNQKRVLRFSKHSLSLSPRPIFNFVEKHPHLVFDYNVVWAVCEAEETFNHKQHCRSAIRIVSVQIMGHTYTHTHNFGQAYIYIYVSKMRKLNQKSINH